MILSNVVSDAMMMTFSLFKLSLFKAAALPAQKISSNSRYIYIYIYIHAVVFLALLKAPQRRESKQSVSVVSKLRTSEKKKEFP